jgi:small subunit ribosomal protein S1
MSKERIQKPKEPTSPQDPELLEDEDGDDGLDSLQEEETPAIAHDDFNWAQANKRGASYTDEDTERYLAEYMGTLTAVGENEIVKARVTQITGSDVVLDLRYKSDGIVALSEFRDIPDLKVGDSVDVYVESQEDERGQLILSRRKAKLLKAWESIVDSYTNGTIIKGQVVSKTKGGLIVDASGLETFLPGSQIDIKPIIDYDSYVGKTMEFKVVKINEAIKNAVVSHKALIESDLAEQREAIISGLEKGQVLEGVVKNITDFGAFMDLGGVDGLLYITDISWGRINHPSDVLALNQKINVVVLDFDENKKRISLGLKQLQSHPWDTLDEKIVESATVTGRVVNIEDYGAFLEIMPGVEGLVHVSEISWSNQPINARDYFQLNQEFEAKIVTIDKEDRKMSLSLKQLLLDPWTDIETRFPDGSRHKGVVKNLTPYGVFVELEDGIGGMVHISDLSWTKRYSHPSEFTSIGLEIDIVVLEIDKEGRKLSLGHKQIEENPWDTFETVFPVGSYHEVVIVRRDDKGAIVQLPYGLEAYAPIKHMRKEDGSIASVEETLTVKVLEFNRDDKRILVSHQRYLEDIRREADDVVRRDERKDVEQTERIMQSQNTRVEKATLGELDVFSQLKEQLQQGNNTDARVEEKKEESVKAEPVVEAPAPEAEESAPVAEEKVTPAPVEAAKKAAVAPVKKAKEAAVAKVEAPVEEKKKSPKVAKEAAKPKAKSAKGDDLKKIEGVGPKIAEILGAAGVDSFAKVADTSVDDLKTILESAGSRYKMFDPTTWPEQAKLAAAGDWDGLKALQGELSGGRR